MGKERILVTGGAGFLGSHLCDRLIDAGHEVVCIDNLLTGDEENIRHLLGHDRFRFRRHDVTVPLDVQCDRIYNLACPASPRHYQQDPIMTARTCVLGAFNLAELAWRQGATILQASTSEVYGDPHVHPQPEGYWGNVNPIGIRSCYDEGKRLAETVFMDHHRQHGVPVKIMRIFNTYGPRMSVDDGRVVSGFIVQALNGEDITVYGDGSQTRSFCYVDDLVEAMIRLMGTEAGFTGPINVGMPREHTILELARAIIALVGSRSRIVFEELPADDPVRRKPDIALARRKLDWSPEVPLEAGLRRTIIYFSGLLRRELKASSS